LAVAFVLIFVAPAFIETRTGDRCRGRFLGMLWNGNYLKPSLSDLRHPQHGMLPADLLSTLDKCSDISIGGYARDQDGKGCDCEVRTNMRIHCHSNKSTGIRSPALEYWVRLLSLYSCLLARCPTNVTALAGPLWQVALRLAAWHFI